MVRLRGEGLRVQRGNFALHVDQLQLHAGEKVALLGENGCGKSTLLQVLAGLLPATGRLDYDGRSLQTYRARERSRLLSYLPQEAGLLFDLSVAELLELDLPSERTLTGAAREHLLEAAGMSDFLERPYHALSGGEKRRAMLARVLCRNTPFMLLDEPTAPLDMRHSARIMAYLAASPHALVVALHDVHLAFSYCDRFILMKRGAIVCDKKKHELEASELEAVFGVRLCAYGTSFVPDYIGPGG